MSAMMKRYQVWNAKTELKMGGVSDYKGCRDSLGEAHALARELANTHGAEHMLTVFDRVGDSFVLVGVVFPGDSPITGVMSQEGQHTT